MRSDEYAFYFKEIEAAIQKGKKPWNEDIEFLGVAKRRVSFGGKLTPQQDRQLVKLYEKMSEPPRIKW